MLGWLQFCDAFSEISEFNVHFVRLYSRLVWVQYQSIFTSQQEVTICPNAAQTQRISGTEAAKNITCIKKKVYKIDP